MCMKKFDAEKIFFDKMTGFEHRHFLKTALYKYWLIVHKNWLTVHNSCNQLLSEL